MRKKGQKRTVHLDQWIEIEEREEDALSLAIHRMTNWKNCV
jgi:hypothetical protein